MRRFLSADASGRRLCLGLALVLNLLLFGDVIFLGSSLAPLDYDQTILAQSRPASPRSLIPERRGREVIDGQGDLWSGSAQFQPAMRFMAYCLRSGESPYWDPYIASGSLGPEILVDVKFGAVTLLAAVLGGSSTALSYVLLALVLAASYSLLRVFTAYLGLSPAAAFAGCAAYLLNGFALANLNLAIGQPYFLAAILLHAMLALARSQTPMRAAVAVTATVAFLSTTFMPTAVLSALVIYSVTATVGLFRYRQSAARMVAILAGAPLAALLVLAFLYLPILDAYASYLHIWGDYTTRRTPGISFVNLLSFFTPKHFWESYAGMRLPTAAPKGPYNQYTFHLGILACLLGLHSTIALTRKSVAVVAPATAWFAIAAGQIFGIPPFTLIDHLPFFSFVQNDYWACMASLSLCLLVGYGYSALATRAPGQGWLVLVGIVACAFWFLYGFLGLHDRFETLDEWTRQRVLVLWLILAVATALLVLLRWPRVAARARGLLLFCLVAEGVYYMNGLRPGRTNRETNVPEVIRALKSDVDRHPGSRVLNIGRLGVFPNWGSGLQIPEVDLMSQFWLPWYEAFYHRYMGSDIFLTLGVNPDAAVYRFSDTSLSLAGVRYVVVDIWNNRASQRLADFGYRVAHRDSQRLIYENPHPLPRAFAVSDVRELDGLPSDIGLDPSRSVATMDMRLIDTLNRFGVSALPREAPPLPPSANDVSLVSYHHDTIRLDCNLAKPGVLVLTDSWNPRWAATVDGQAAYVGQVDVAFRGVAVPAGKHIVRFRYRPWSRILGQAISGMSVLGLAVGLWLWRRRSGSTAIPPAAPEPTLAVAEAPRRRRTKSQR